MGRRLLTTEQAVHAAGVKAGTLHQWSRRGHIRNYGDGYRALWDLAELDHRMRTKDRSRPRVA